MKQISIYTDGSALSNPGPAGWAAILEYKGNIKELVGRMDRATNNQMELLAVIKGLQALKEPCNVTVYSDSQYVVNGINSWLKNWIKNNWKGSNKKPVKNVDYWQMYLCVAESHNINAIWVKGHNGHYYNERCDTLAVNQAKSV